MKSPTSINQLDIQLHHTKNEAKLYHDHIRTHHTKTYYHHVKYIYQIKQTRLFYSNKGKVMKEDSPCLKIIDLKLSLPTSQCLQY